MTYAPASIRALATYWVSQGGVNLGIVGDTAHAAKGYSYHLGKSQLASTAYSIKTARDRAGLTEAASALDIGKLGTVNYGRLRAFSRWLVEHCRDNAPGTSDVREVIYTPDGKVVMRWDRERGVTSLPRAGEADNSHLTHTHISFYRDSEARSKTGLFTPYFTGAPEVDSMLTPALDPSEYRPLRGVRVKAGTKLYKQASTASQSVGLNDTSIYPLFGNNNASTAWRGVLVDTPAFYSDGKTRPTIAYIQGSAIVATVDLPIPKPDCSAAVDEALAPFRKQMDDLQTNFHGLETAFSDLSGRVDRALAALG